MLKFIVLSGKKQAGKTVSAQFLKTDLEARGKSVHITSFASPIKDFCIQVVGLTEAQVYGSDKEKNSFTHILWENMPLEILNRYATNISGDFYYDYKYGPMTAREVMQIFGTDIMRNFFDFDIWAKAPFRKYAESEYDFVIIDDCRFPNEAGMAIKYDALLIRLKRNVLGDDVHISEKALDDYPEEKYTEVIDNNEYVDIVTLYDALNVVAGRIV